MTRHQSSPDPTVRVGVAAEPIPAEAEAHLLRLLASNCTSLFHLAASCVMLPSPIAGLRLAASSGESALLRVLFPSADEDHVEGPCVDGYTLEQQVSETDLVTDPSRWPAFAQLADQAGILAVHVMPLQTAGQTIGALGLFATHTTAVTADQERLIHALAEVTAIAVVGQRAAEDAHVRAGQLQTALDSRVPIEQAKGILAALGGIRVDQAFHMLRAYVRSNRLMLTEVARQIAAGERDTKPILATPTEPRTKPRHTRRSGGRARSGPPPNQTPNPTPHDRIDEDNHQPAPDQKP
ncbi:ANTAR domain-containing protein [Actinopolymorpha singaporensis]|uniref:GAF domain-containing protein n=1 Tax=Actinopolymorpha singaporensis TaxID=117157 RepID=A0A1H1LQ03_9ACTN|nr:GAF and ANTAR domain-containing protein [Actinopolymorpha singaporensis]SDR76392.1 GAF domain-containing protein [Actinopolymorpha singaporensis]